MSLNLSGDRFVHREWHFSLPSYIVVDRKEIQKVVRDGIGEDMRTMLLESDQAHHRAGPNDSLGW
jgi:hypothetical protein